MTSKGLTAAQVEEFKKWLQNQHEEMIRRGDRCERDDLPLQTRTWWGKGSAYLITLKKLAEMDQPSLKAPHTKTVEKK